MSVGGARAAVARWALFGALLLGGCAVQPEADWRAALRRQIGTSGELGADRRALAVPAPDAALAQGDAVAFGVVLQTGGSTKTWRIAIEVDAIAPRPAFVMRGVPAFEARLLPSEARQRQIEAAQAAFRDQWRDGTRRFEELAQDMPIASIRVEAFGADGAPLGVGESEAIVTQLQRGLLPACRAGYRQRECMRGRVALGMAAPVMTVDDAVYDDVREVALGVDACERFFRILRENAVMRDILWEVLALPSLWSILTNWGVKASFSVDFFAAEPVDPACFPGEHRELWSVPMVVLFNGQPGLLAQVIVGPSGAPDGVVAGVYGIVARHPTDTGRRVHVQLLASRRAH